LGVRVGVVCTGVVARCFVLLVRKEERRGRGSKRGGRWRRSGSSRSSRTCRRILPPPAAQAQSRKICSTGKRRLWVHQIAHTLAASFWSQFTSLQTTHSNRPRYKHAISLFLCFGHSLEGVHKITAHFIFN
jgi:hypothetical protein